MEEKPFSIKKNCSLKSVDLYYITEIQKQNEFFYFENQSYITNLYPELLSCPHRLDFFVILCFFEGVGVLEVDCKDYYIEPNTLMFLSPNQLIHVKRLNNFKGISIAFSEGFMSKLSKNVRDIIIFDLLSRNKTKCRFNSLDMEYIIDNIKGIKCRYLKVANIKRKSDYLASMLSLLLLDITVYGVWDNNVTNNKSILVEKLFLDFQICVEQNYRELHNVQDYADKLSISFSRLNNCVLLFAGVSPSHIIDERISQEAKYLLLNYYNKSVKEIAFELGFSDNSNFVKFFKRIAGMTPTRFRNTNRREYIT